MAKLRGQRIFSVLLFALAVMFVSVSCTSDSVSGGDAPVVAIELSDSSLVFAVSAEPKVVKVKTEAEEIEVSSTQDWCVAEYNSSTKRITISLEDNLALNLREAVVKVSSGGTTESIAISQFGIEPSMIVESDTIVSDFKAKTLAIDIYSNVDLSVTSKVSWMTQAVETKSVTIDPVKYSFNIQLNILPAETELRSGQLIFSQTEGELSDTITVMQQLLAGDTYSPESVDSFEQSDRKLENIILSGTLSPSDLFASGNGIEKTYDGNTSTTYLATPDDGLLTARETVSFEYALDSSSSTIVNYLMLYFRTNLSGVIKHATVWVKTASSSEWTQVSELENALSYAPCKVAFDAPVLNPTALKIEVTDTFYPFENTGKYQVSLAEVEFYEARGISSLANDQVYFTDETFSELVSGFSTSDLSKIENPFLQNMAAYMLAGEYDSEFRVQEYEPYRPHKSVKAELKNIFCNLYENPTGIYFNAGDEAVVFVEKDFPTMVKLIVKDFSTEVIEASPYKQYDLREGMNVIKVTEKGNAYVRYFTDAWESSPKVKLHFASGGLNGYFDATKHTNEDGARILDNATGDFFDVKGKYIQFTFPIEGFRINARERMADLMAIYDSIISAQYAMTGLHKYNRVPKNHMFGRMASDESLSNYGAYSAAAFADSYGTCYGATMIKNVFTNPDRVLERLSMLSHEFGHVNQVSPQFMWVGMREVSNNIHPRWSLYCVNGVSSAIGASSYNGYFTTGILAGHEYGLQQTTVDAYGANSDGLWQGNGTISLIPLWQLMVYYHIAGEGNSWNKPYIYADIFEAIRNTTAPISDGQCQVDFVKHVCDAAEQDLSDFFLKNGMLKVVNKKYYDEQGVNRTKTITQTMIDEALEHISQYPKPEGVLQYISLHNYEAYKNRAQVSGTFNTGVTGTTEKVISHSVWKNAVVFETYAGDEVTAITMLGTGDSTNSSTTVPYPSGSTKIMAVSYDGTRTLVCE
ncbi:MAG: M60 family metallopeptidase [Mangrovibacterium sp.]